MYVLRNGLFAYQIDNKDLSRGLRPTKRSPRNARFLVTCVGAVGLDEVLQVIDNLQTDRINSTATIADTFPYPQLFVFTNVIIVCGKTNIYEYASSTLTKVIGPVTTGEIWSAVDFYDFIYMTNNVVSIVRSPTSGVYSLTTDYPIAGSLCNFNGQVIAGGISS